MPNKEIDYRQSPLRDDKLITHTSVVKEHFITHREAFANFNSTVFHAAYPDEFQGKINLAEQTISDGFILKTQVRHTNKVEEHKGELVRELASIDFTVKRAFAQDPSIVNEFRLNKISEMSKNIDSLIGFSKDVHVMIQNYQTELIAEGFTNDKTDHFKKKIEDLDKLRRIQVEAMHTRPLYTKDRIMKMNQLWKQLGELKEASDIIFADELEIKALFALPKASTRSSDDEEENEINLDEDDITAVDDESSIDESTSA